MIDLKDYIAVIKKRYVLILIITLIAAVIGFIYTEFSGVKYQSSINIYTTDAADLTGYLQTNHAIDYAYTKFTGNEKYTQSQLSYFRSNIRSIQVSNNIVSLQITTSNKNLSLDWIRAFQSSIYSTHTSIYINKVLYKEYKSCLNTQKQAMKIDKTNKELTPVPSCIYENFVEYNPGGISTISIIPSKTLNIILFAISGALLSLIIISYKEYNSKK
jgi:uncharacterized protein involved in exopolysaccharide biosynthesis